MAKSSKENNVNSDNSIITILKERFNAQSKWQDNLLWDAVEQRLLGHPKILQIIEKMEATEGMPHIVGTCGKTNGLLIYDCAEESPKSRRSLCYDLKALEERKEHKPVGNVLDAVKAIGSTLMDEATYRHLQSLGNFDLKTSSWLTTPEAIRKLGGAIFGDKRYDQVFIYHNGASSYYGSRGYRTFVLVP